MSNPENPQNTGGWVPPAVGGSRLPPYAPAPVTPPPAPSAPTPGPGAAPNPGTPGTPPVPPTAAYPSFTPGSDAPTEMIPVIPASAAVEADVPEVITPDSAPVRRTRSETRRQRRDPIRTAARGLGQTLISLGVVVLLFVVYEVYITDIFGAQKQAEATKVLDIKWEEAHSETAAPGTVVVTAPPEPVQQEVDPAQRTATYDLTMGDAFAKIFIPAFGADYRYSIIEGTNPDDLYVGPGHYEDSQLPGEVGNFAVAGHRVSKGSPFNQLDKLNSCDALIVETQDEWFIYRVLPMDTEMATWDPTSRPQCADVPAMTGLYAGIPGREITLPSDYAQVHPIPHQAAAGADGLAAATERLITLTTCHPQFSDAERMIVHGLLVKTYAKADGFLPPELAEG